MIVDTNVLLRSLDRTAQPQPLAAGRRIASARAARVRLTVLSATMLEMAFVLHSPNAGYHWDKSDVVDALEAVLDDEAFAVEHSVAMKTAVSTYRTRSMDLHDCFLSALANERDIKVLSFDDDLRKLGNRELP